MNSMIDNSSPLNGSGILHEATRERILLPPKSLVAEKLNSGVDEIQAEGLKDGHHWFIELGFAIAVQNNPNVAFYYGAYLRECEKASAWALANLKADWAFTAENLKAFFLSAYRQAVRRVYQMISRQRLSLDKRMNLDTGQTRGSSLVSVTPECLREFLAVTKENLISICKRSRPDKRTVTRVLKHFFPDVPNPREIAMELPSMDPVKIQRYRREVLDEVRERLVSRYGEEVLQDLKAEILCSTPDR